MQQFRHAMQFRGRAETVEKGFLTASAQAPSTRITSVVGGSGLESHSEEVDGQAAEYTSEARRTGGSSFTETGTIRFATGNILRFNTIVEGILGPGPEGGPRHGSIMLRVDGGEGQFQGSTGVITSNFTLSMEKDVIGNQFGVIWVR